MGETFPHFFFLVENWCDMNKLRTLILAIFVIAIGCDEKEKDEEVIVPTNLAIEIEAATNGSGKVSVTATAEGAKYFTIFFGESSADAPIVTNDGKAEHTYGSSGTYTIKVQAHAAITAYITEEKTVTVTIPTNAVIPTEGYTTPASYSGMTLVWQDEFNGPTINESDWTFEIGRGSNGWGNDELEYYKKENAEIQEGNLVITAKKESAGGANYTSTRMITKGKQSFQYGRIDIRAVLPQGKGIWPALWMLGDNIGSVGWPKCGEIDIMEMIGGGVNDQKVYGTLHWDENNQYKCTCGGPSHTLASGKYADKFHVFSIVWTESLIIWYVDDTEFLRTDISPADRSEFRAKQFFIFNVAVGGRWPGSPDATTIFPQRMIVDYVRVFQNN
jgi:beta-glucanase (GH16 family)